MSESRLLISETIAMPRCMSSGSDLFCSRLLTYLSALLRAGVRRAGEARLRRSGAGVRMRAGKGWTGAHKWVASMFMSSTSSVATATLAP